MYHRIRCVRQTAAAASLSLLALLAGCGVLGGSGDDDKQIVVGTTSAPSTLDPAAAWDSSWELFRNIYQTLLAYPVGTKTPEPDAAESCKFVGGDGKTYRCTLREGLKFSNGDPLNAQSVKYSIDRITRIGLDAGPAGLLGTLDNVATKGDLEVTFHLTEPDATFPFVLATPAMSIVDPKTYPADKVRSDGEVTGSGPYTLKHYAEGEEAELVRNDRYGYKGLAERRNNAVTIRYFHDSTSMVKALESKEIDLTVRGLGARDVVRFQGTKAPEDLQLIEQAGTETSNLFFNPKDKWAGKLPVRKAIAQIIDRGAIANKVYKDTVDPLYSMIPQSLVGHSASYFDTYGQPSVSKARAYLRDAGIYEPVPLTFWYTTDRYGSETKPMFEEIKEQLDDSGLFRITIKGRPWTEYAKGYGAGEYPVFGRGWSPDYPDPDDFISPFIGPKNAIGTPYETPGNVSRLLSDSRKESDRGEVQNQFEQISKTLTEDARLVPLWQSKLYVAASDDISGVESAWDGDAIMCMWTLSRKTSW